MPAIVLALLSAFGIWMLIDAIRRGVPPVWYFVILFLPLGSVIYFFFVKIHDYAPGRVARETAEPGDSSPTVDNQFSLAGAYEQRGDFVEAARLYQSVLATRPTSKDALYGIARCRLSMDDAQGALEPLERLMELDRGYADFGAALNYAEALFQSDRADEAIELVEALAAFTGRLNHKLAHAHYLSLDGSTDRARAIIEAGLSAYERETRSEQKKQKRWAQEAREMLQELAEPDTRAP